MVDGEQPRSLRFVDNVQIKITSQTYGNKHSLRSSVEAAGPRTLSIKLVGLRNLSGETAISICDRFVCAPLSIMSTRQRQRFSQKTDETVEMIHGDHAEV